MAKSTKKLVCIVEDDTQKRITLWDHYETAFREKFDLRFIICEQHFLSTVLHQNPITVVGKLQGGPLYDPAVDNMPDLFVVDMMLQWSSRWFHVDGLDRNPLHLTHLAGLRIGEELQKFKPKLKKRLNWFYWTAVDCEALRAALGDIELYYKEDLSSIGLLETLEKLV